jgi:quinol monooxygenase YgiN
MRKAWQGGCAVIIEMRTYKTKPGRRSDFLDIFERKSVPAHDEIGMKILGPFPAVEDPDTFFFMRGFPDLPSREPMKAKFYEGELWKRELENVLMPMLEKWEAVVVEDTNNVVAWERAEDRRQRAKGNTGAVLDEEVEMSFHSFVRFEPKPGKRAQLAGELMRLIEPTRAEPACVRIHLYEAVREPPIFYFHSEWVDEAAFDAHAQTPHMVRFLSLVDDLITHPLKAVRTKRIG